MRSLRGQSALTSMRTAVIFTVWQPSLVTGLDLPEISRGLNETNKLNHSNTILNYSRLRPHSKPQRPRRPGRYSTNSVSGYSSDTAVVYVQIQQIQQNRCGRSGYSNDIGSDTAAIQLVAGRLRNRAIKK
eukprot:2795449-Prymnesium_polylepis.1